MVKFWQENGGQWNDIYLSFFPYAFWIGLARKEKVSCPSNYILSGWKWSFFQSAKLPLGGSALKRTALLEVPEGPTSPDLQSRYNELLNAHQSRLR